MPDGYCHICGKYGPLSFEHVPPKAAFNNQPVTAAKFDDAMRAVPGARLPGKVLQRGRGDYTLCGQCNNRTGAWYAPNFIQWAFQGAVVLQKTNGKPTLLYLNYLFPLRIVKQVVTMFFSVNHSGFRRTYPDLEPFLLNREHRYLDKRLRVYAYYNLEGNLRSTGIMVKGGIRKSGISLFSETSFPPYGFVMTYDSPPPDDRVVDITHVSRYPYTQFAVMTIDLPVLPTHLPYGGDYSTIDQIRGAYERNTGKPFPDTDPKKT